MKWIKKTYLEYLPLRLLNSRQFPEYFGLFVAAWSYSLLKKISPLYLRKNLLATAGNLKVNEQTKYKSVPIIFYS